MNDTASMLKTLLQQRHWQTYRTFQREYDKAARSVDPSLVGGWPSRAQFGRWLSGQLKGLPYPDHCRVLEKMFPGWTIEQLFAPGDADDSLLALSGDKARLHSNGAAHILQVIEDRLDEPEAERAEWGPSERPQTLPRGSIIAALNSQGTAGQAADTSAFQIARRLLDMKQRWRLSDGETKQLAGLAGCVIEMSESLEIDIDKAGEAHLSYTFDLLNLSAKPLTRVTRELWFEVTTGRVEITPADGTERRVKIQRIHDTANLSKFAFHISPPLQPGECAKVGYSCDGGGFGERHYWRQAFPRYTRHYTIRVRQQDVQILICSASEEFPDGSENSANDSLTWDYADDSAVMTLTRDYLRPNQTVTLRWEVNRGTA